MTNSNHSLIATLIDRSGSMHSIKEDTEGGYTAFMEEQRSSLGEGESIECWLSQFDDRYEAVFTATDISELPSYELRPRGMTALVDSLHRLIGEIGENLALRPEDERPGKVIILVLTDGQENSSREVTAHQLKELIQSQEKNYSWQFIFLGANLDAVSVGATYGIASGRALTYGADSQGVSGAFAAAANVTQTMRRAAPEDLTNVSFSQEHRDSALGRGETKGSPEQ